MRTRSSRSYALVHPDEYEIAGHGLLNTIEESFYLDDGESDLGEKEQAVGEDDLSSGLSSLASDDEEGPIPVYQPRSLIVKLRLPSKNPTPTLSSRLETDESTLGQARPSLMVMLRMPRPAGQVEALVAEDTVVRPSPIETPDAAAAGISNIASERTHEEVVGIEAKAQVQSELPDRLHPVPAIPAPRQAQEGPRFEEEREMEQPLMHLAELESRVAVQEDVDIVMHDDLAPTDNHEDQSIEVARVDEDVAVGHMEDQTAALDEEATEDNSYEIEEGVHLMEQREQRAQIVSGDSEEIQPQDELQPETEVNAQPSGDNSSPEDSSLNSSHIDDDAWPSTETLEDQSACLLPTPLTMPSPDPSVLDAATSPQEQSQASRSMKQSSVREVTPPPSEERGLPLQRPPSQSGKHDLPLEAASSQSKKHSRPLGDAPSHAKKRRRALEDESCRSEKRSLSIAGAPSQSKMPKLPLKDAPFRSGILPNLPKDPSCQPKKRSLPLDDALEAEERPQKKQRRQEEKQAKKSNTGLQNPPKSKHGTGVVATQKGQGNLSVIDHAASGTVHKSQQRSKKVVKKPPKKSGRDYLLEQSKVHSLQRPQGGNRFRTKMPPAARRRREQKHW